MHKFFRKDRIPTKIVEAKKYINKISIQKTALLTDRLKNYIENMVPKMEEKIEIDILNKIYSQTQDPLFKEEILKSYERRKYDKKFLTQRNQYEIERLKIEQISDHIDYYPMSYNNFQNCNANDVGKFFDFPLEEFSKLFPSMNFGHKDFYENNLSQSGKFAFLLRKECFQLIQILKRKMKLDNMSFEDLNIQNKLQNIENKENLDYVYSDINLFFKIYYSISSDLCDALQKYKYDDNLHTVVSNCFAFDQIILFFTWQMDNKELREIIINDDSRKQHIQQFVDWLMQHPMVNHLSPGSQNLAETFYFFQFGNKKIDLVKQQQYFEKIPTKLKPFLLDGFLGFDSGILFHGSQGAGKSMALYQMIMFARVNDWIITKIPSTRQITQNLWEDMKRHEQSKLYINPKISVKLLEDLYLSNQETFKKFKVNLDIYGKYNQTGVHDDEPNPAKNFYIENRRRHLDDYEQENPKLENKTEEYQEELKQQKRRINLELKEPQTLSEIAEFGLKHKILATNAIAEILEQVYNQDKKYVMILVDDYNWMFRPSSQVSLRYSDLKKLNFSIPPYHIALCRLFMKFDGHLIKKGFKVAGTCNFEINKHNFEPKKINFPESSCVKLNGVDYETFRNFKQFRYIFNLDLQEEHSENFIKFFWTYCQGHLGVASYIGQNPEKRDFEQSQLPNTNGFGELMDEQLINYQSYILIQYYDVFMDFAIQEFLSLLDMYDIPRESLFKYELQDKEFDETKIDLSLFKNYPFLILDIDPQYNPQLLKIFARAISLKRIGVLLAHGQTYEDLQKMVKSNKDCDSEVTSQETFAFKIITHEQTLDRKQQIKKIENLGFQQFQGQCDLKNPQRVFIIGENYTSEKEFLHVYLAKDITKQFKTRLYTYDYILKDRAFLGPTSTDENLAFMMINSGKVQKGSFVFDPFFGSGSILIAASAMGAQCYGGEIDYRILHGLGVGQLNKRTSYKKRIEKEKLKIDGFLNFTLYGLDRPEILRIDSVGTQFKVKQFFDAIICDPPYGLRAGVRETSNNQDKRTDPQSSNYITPTKKAECLQVTKKLFDMGRNLLSQKGRLVFLYPQSVKSKFPEELYKQEGYKLISVCQNPLNTKLVRLMITYEKTQLNQFLDLFNIMLKLTFVVFSIIIQTKSFGTNCRQLIQDHFFDLSYLMSDNDYQFLYQNLNEEIEFNFNFCKYINKICKDTSQHTYYMVAFNQETCQYFDNNNLNKQSFYLIENENQKGLGISYQGVQDTSKFIDLQILCDHSTKDLLIQSVEQLQQDKYRIITKSQYGCPKIINSILADLFNSMKYLIVIIGLIVGPMLLLYGSQFFGLALMIVIQQDQFFTYNDIMSIFYEDSQTSIVYAFVVLSILAGVFGSLAIMKVEEAGVWILGAASGFFLCIFLNYCILYKIKSSPDNLFFTNALFIFSFAGALAGRIYRNIILIISTSIVGSYITIRSISLIFGGFPSETTFNRDFNLNSLHQKSWSIILYILLILILFVFGVVFQYKRRYQKLIVNYYVNNQLI